MSAHGLTAIRLRWTRPLLFAPICLAVVAGCGGHKGTPQLTPAQKTADAAAKAKAACEVFANFKPPGGSGSQAQVNYAKATAHAFHDSAALAQVAGQEDPTWASLASSAKTEAAAFDVIVSASTTGVSGSGTAAVNRAAAQTRSARPVFLAACMKADPGRFTGAGTQTPAPTAS